MHFTELFAMISAASYNSTHSDARVDTNQSETPRFHAQVEYQVTTGAALAEWSSYKTQHWLYDGIHDAGFGCCPKRF